MKTVKLCYCGGCNPRYDRVAAVRMLSGAFPEIQFSDTDGMIGLAVCGCERACIKGDIQLTGFSEFPRVKKKLKELCSK